MYWHYIPMHSIKYYYRLIANFLLQCNEEESKVNKYDDHDIRT